MKPLLAVARTDIVRVFADVPEMDARWVETGRPGYVQAQALGDAKVDGKVTRTSWALGPNRTLRVELDLPNAGGQLRPGMYATVHLVLQERTDALAIPVSAVIRDGGRTFCWLAKDRRATRRPITLGLQVENLVEVAAGLEAEDLVIQTPPGPLEEGQPVEAVQPNTP